MVDDVTSNAEGDEDDHDIATVEAPTFSIGTRSGLILTTNGVVDSGEVGVTGVTVLLFRDNDDDGQPDDINGDGLIDSANDAIATAFTDADGLYLFSGLEPGEYVVGIPGL